MKTIKRYGITIFGSILALALIAILLMAINSNAEPLDTYQTGWNKIRAAAKEDAGTFAETIALDSNEGDFAHKESTAFRIRATERKGSMYYSYGGAWVFTFFGSDAANDTFSFNLVGWSATNGMVQVICEGSGVLGSQDVVKEPDGTTAPGKYWADTITLDETTKWPSVGVYNSGDNEVAMLAVDLTGLEYIDFIIYDANGTAEASTIGVYGRRY